MDMPELTTTVRVDGVSAHDLPAVADAVEAALVTVIHDEGQAAVTAYFVTVQPEESSFTIGLRFEGMDPQHIEGTASDLLTLTLERLGSFADRGATARRTSSQLVGV
jgi:hypothetical protein